MELTSVPTHRMGMRIRREITKEACRIRPGSEPANAQIPLVILVFQKGKVRLREVTKRFLTHSTATE